MNSLKLLRILNYLNYFVFTNIIIIGIIIYFPPTSQNYGSNAWGHTLSKVTQVEQLIILIINFFLIPIVITYIDKEIYLKKIKKKIILNSYPFNFIFFIIVSISSIHNFAYELMIVISSLALFLNKKTKILFYKLCLKKIYFYLLIIFFSLYANSPLLFFKSFISNFSYIYFISFLLSSLIIIFYLIFLTKNTKFIKTINILLITLISILFLDVSFNIDLLHAMAWISPTISEFKLGYDIFAQYGFFTSYILKFLSKNIFSNYDLFNLYILKVIFFQYLSYFLLGLIFLKISKDKFYGLIFFLIFLFIITSASTNTQITPSVFSLRFFPLILITYIILNSKLNFNKYLLGFLGGLFLFWSLEVFLWAVFIISSLILSQYLIHKNFNLFLKNIIYFYSISLITIFFIFFIIFIINFEFLNYYDYLELISNYKSGWAINPVLNFTVPFFVLFCISSVVNLNYKFIIFNEKNYIKERIDIIVLLSLMVCCYSYYLGRSTPTLFYLTSWSFLIFLFHLSSSFVNVYSYKLIRFILFLILIFPLNVGIYNTLFTEKYLGNNIIRNLYQTNFNLNLNYLNLKDNINKNHYSRLNKNIQEDITDIKKLLEQYSDDKVIILVSQNLNSLSNLAFYFSKKQNILPISYDLIDAHSKKRIESIFKYIEEIPNNSILITYTNYEKEITKMHYLEQIILNSLKEKYIFCEYEIGAKYSLYRLSSQCNNKI